MWIGLKAAQHGKNTFAAHAREIQLLHINAVQKDKNCTFWYQKKKIKNP